MSDQLKFIPLLTVLINRFVNGLLTRCCFDFKAFDIVKNAALPKFKLEAIVKSYMKRRRKRKNIGERSLETGEELNELNGTVKKASRMDQTLAGFIDIKDNF